jgi:uncharacterized protein (TIGR00369 family)
MAAFAAQDPNFEARVRTSFDRQNLNRTIGARLGRVAPGAVEIELPFREALGQQQGFIHGGIVAAIVDTACGYAALTLTPADAEVLTVEFKINFVAPAQGERLLARGRVAKAGRTLSVCTGDVVAVSDATEKLVATMLATIMVVSRGRGDPAPEQHRPPTSRHRTLDQHAIDRSSPRPPWCPCRGRGWRQRLREIVGEARLGRGQQRRSS